MFEKKLPTPPGYLSARLITAERRQIEPAAPKPRKKTKLELFAELIATVSGPFSTCELAWNKSRANELLNKLIELGKVRQLPEKGRRPHSCKPVILYEVIR